MREQLKFLDIRERTDPESIAAEGRYAHDLGLEIFGPGWELLDKADLAFASTQGQAVHDRLYEEVRARIAAELEKIDE